MDLSSDMEQMTIFSYDHNYETTIEDLERFLKDKFPQYEWIPDDVYEGFVYKEKKREVDAHILTMYTGEIKLGCGFQNRYGDWHGCSVSVEDYEELERKLTEYLERKK